MRRAWVSVVGVALVAIASAFALSLNSGGRPTVIRTKATASKYGEIVFYSGLGEAGVAEADPYSGWEFVDANHLGGPHYSDWTIDDCSPYASDDFPSDAGLHILAGYSLGRLGPVYFLRAAEARWSEIDTIYLIDPGPLDEMSASCDARRDRGRPSEVLQRWLAQGANRRLVILSGQASQADDGAGIKVFYLYNIYRSTEDVADRVFYCLDNTGTAHKDMVKEFIPSLRRLGVCPAGTTREAVVPISSTTTTRLSTTTTQPGVPPTSPGSTPPSSAPEPSDLNAPPASTPPGTAPPTSSPTTPLPSSRTLTVYNRVTNGPSAMREDTPSYLSSVTQNFCRTRGCMLSGTDVLNTGSTVTAECWALGDRTTNGQDNSAGDDSNPGLYETRLWYLIAWPDGRKGWLSEVWIQASERHGAGLARCS
jgi:hypothetical protein